MLGNDQQARDELRAVDSDKEGEAGEKAILTSLNDLPLDQQEENKGRSEGQEQAFCKEGHRMKLIEGSENQNGWVCDLCGKSSSVGEKVQAWRCDQGIDLGHRIAMDGCDFDICTEILKVVNAVNMFVLFF